MKTKSTAKKEKSKGKRSIFNATSSPGFFGFQPKLTTGKPGDKYEQEADNIASKVVNHSGFGPGQFFDSSNSPFFNNHTETIQEKPLAETITPMVQKKEEEEELQAKQPENFQLLEEEEEPVQTQTDEGEEEIQAKSKTGFEGPEDDKYVGGPVEEEEDIQAKQTGETTVASSIENNLKNSTSHGNKLDPVTLAEMEYGFGTDLSGVNIHTDSKAVQMNKELGAQAFTHGKDIYFNQGKYSPKSQDGKHLLAHELTHTIQQAGMVPMNLQFTIGDGHDLTAPRFAGNEVLEACYDNERILQSGASGVAVTLIQQALIDAGFPLPEFGADGIFGNETRQALMDFQRTSLLAVDGKVGPATMSALNALFTGGAPSLPPAVPVTPQPITPPNVSTETIKSAPDGTVNTRTTVGVGERVRFTADTSGTWAVSEGHIIGLNTGANIVWEAPAVASRPAITITSPGGSRTVTMNVIAPDGLSMVVVNNEPIAVGTAGACMINQVEVTPLSVNFGRTQWFEVPGPATNVTGYYNRFPAAELFHRPNPNYLPFDDNNSGLFDHAATHNEPTPHSFGTFDWVVPNRYKIDGEPDAQGRHFVNTTQAFTIFGSGTVVITKAGAFVLRFINNTIINSTT